MYQKKAVGRRLKSGLSDQGLTTEEFAKRIGVSAESVKGWCNGRVVMSFENAVKVCDELNWPLDRLARRMGFEN